MGDLLLYFHGDGLTGSTDVMEAAALFNSPIGLLIRQPTRRNRRD